MPRSYIPSIVSLISVLLGFFAIQYAMYGDYEVVIQLIFGAAICDYLDGLVARKMNSVSIFGGQIDSLCDAFIFGFVPSIAAYFWIISTFQILGIVLCFTVSAAVIVRLARFNTLQIIGQKDYKGVNTEKFFVGIPAPLFGMLCLFPIALVGLAEDINCKEYTIALSCESSILYLLNQVWFKASIVFYYIFISFLAVSAFPVLAFKSVRISGMAVKIIIGITAFASLFLLLYNPQVLTVILGCLAAMWIVYSIIISSRT